MTKEQEKKEASSSLIAKYLPKPEVFDKLVVEEHGEGALGTETPKVGRYTIGQDSIVSYHAEDLSKVLSSKDKGKEEVVPERKGPTHGSAWTEVITGVKPDGTIQMDLSLEEVPD